MAQDAAAFTLAGRAVDVELAALKSSADLNPGEESALAVVLRAWRVTDASRRAVLASGADSASPVQVLLRPVFEEEMNISLTEVTAQLTTLDDLISADLAARQHARDTAETASAVAIAAAITIGFVAACGSYASSRSNKRPCAGGNDGSRPWSSTLVMASW